MCANASDCNKELEYQMQNMCNYLEKLVTSDDDDENNNKTYGGEFASTPVANKDLYQNCDTDGLSDDRSHTIVACTSKNASGTAPLSFSQFKYANFGASPSYPNNSLTSILSNLGKTASFNPNFPVKQNSRFNKRVNYKNTDKEADTSSIDIKKAMVQLGLTPELFGQNDVYKLFSLFDNLEFSINAEYISHTVYDQRTIPKTMSVSAQIKFAVWSCYKLHRKLREVLQRPLPAEFKPAYNECEEAMNELQGAIACLETFKQCTLEHRKGEFISPDAKDQVQPLMNTLTHLIKCVEKSRMFIQVYERALNAPERYKLALIAPQMDLPQSDISYADEESASRALTTRRYIG